MTYSGYFKTYDNKKTYTVTIGNGIGVTHDIIDPLDESYDYPDKVMFDPDPVTITADRQDLQKRIIISQATINLISNTDLTEDFFANTSREIPVEITCDGNTVFYGYVDPLQFDQGYAYNWEKIQVNATDPLGALEEMYIGQIQDIDQESTLTTTNLINAILETAGIELVDYAGVNEDVMDAMDNTNIKLWNFFGDSQDDWMTLDESLSEICRYFNLYVAYWNGAAHVTCTINNTPSAISIQSFKEAAADTSTSISVDETYAQAMLTCEIEPEDDLITSITDKDFLKSDFKNAEVYMNEVISSGEGHDADDQFKHFLWPERFRDIGYEHTWEMPNYIQVLKNEAWDFGSNSYLSQNSQIGVLGWLKQNPGRGALLGFGRGTKQNKLDNSIQAPPDISPYFVISTCGTYDDSTTGKTAMESICGGDPVCEYIGLASAILSPPDSTITNYIVISGKILLNPLQKLTGPLWSKDEYKIQNTIEGCKTVWSANSSISIVDGHAVLSTTWHHTVPHPSNDDGAYYQQKWVGLSQSSGVGSPGIYGYLDNEKNKDLKYEYNNTGDRIDTLTKLPIIACQLVVGDKPDDVVEGSVEDTRKWCCERLFDGERGQNDFEWRTLYEWRSIFNTVGVENAATAYPYITIGIDPAIDDCIVGQSKGISINVPGFNGTAIPIKYTDQLSGNVSFKILGPYNTVWHKTNKTTHRKWLFWKCSHMSDEYIPILQHAQSIMISNLKIELNTDGGAVSEYAMNADNDLVYYSATDPTYLNRLEETVKICTPLTLAECETTGVKYQISNSYVYTTENKPFYGLGGHMEDEQPVGYIKPEECLVDYYYREYHEPSRMISTKLFGDKVGSNGLYGQMINADMLNSYVNGLAISGNYRIMSYEADLKRKTVDYTFRVHNTISNNQI